MDLFNFVKKITEAYDAVDNDKKSKCYKDPTFKDFACDDECEECNQ